MLCIATEAKPAAACDADLLRVEGAVLASEALANHFGILVDEHGRCLQHI
jgi:hypothetical protein